MDELIKQIMQKTGLSNDKAKSVIDMVTKFLSDKLPAPVADQVKAVLSGGSPAGVADTVKGLFGKK